MTKPEDKFCRDNFCLAINTFFIFLVFDPQIQEKTKVLFVFPLFARIVAIWECEWVHWKARLPNKLQEQIILFFCFICKKLCSSNRLICSDVIVKAESYKLVWVIKWWRVKLGNNFTRVLSKSNLYKILTKCKWNFFLISQVYYLITF